MSATPVLAPQQSAPAQPAASASPADVPELIPGTELLGQERDSALVDAPYLVRRADGEIVQVAGLLFLIAAEADGTRSLEDISRSVSRKLGRLVSPANLSYVVERKLRPLGLLLNPDRSVPALRRLDPLLGLRFRVRLLSASVVGAIAGALRFLFLPPIVAAVLLVLAAADVWLVAAHGVEGGISQVIDEPSLLLALVVATGISMLLHEFGHAAACRYSGGRPSAIGAGVYIVWPVLFSDVTESYRFDRRSRLRTDLGGVYFNAIIVVAAMAAYALTRYEPLILLAVSQQLMIFNQFLPWVRLDGYYLVSDLIGVSNLFGHMRPALRSLLPGRADERSAALKAWARVAVRVWVAVAVVGLGGLAFWVVTNAHAILARAADSLVQEAGRIEQAVAGADALTAIAALTGAVMLLLPPLGLTLTFWLLCRRAGLALGSRDR